MSYTSLQILTAIAPSLGTSDEKNLYLALAEERISSDSFGTKRNFAVAYRAAHDMAMAIDPVLAGGSTSGAIQSKREGDLSVSYFAPQTNSTSMSGSSELSLTKFGLMLLGLMKGNIVTFGVTGSEVTDFTPRME